jgi:hypothetical protein
MLIAAVMAAETRVGFAAAAEKSKFEAQRPMKQSVNRKPAWKDIDNAVSGRLGSATRDRAARLPRWTEDASPGVGSSFRLGRTTTVQTSRSSPSLPPLSERK